jgi:hypothetical protein
MGHQRQPGPRLGSEENADTQPGAGSRSEPSVVKCGARSGREVGAIGARLGCSSLKIELQLPVRRSRIGTSFSRSAAGAVSAKPRRGQRAPWSSSKRTDTGATVRAHVRVDARWRCESSDLARWQTFWAFQAFAPNPGEGAGALGLRVTPRSASCRVMVADAAAGAAAPVLGCRQRTSEVGAEWASPNQPQGRGWSLPGRVRERRARPSAVRAALTPLRPKLARANTSATFSLRTGANSVGCDKELDDSAMVLRSS